MKTLSKIFSGFSLITLPLSIYLAIQFWIAGWGKFIYGIHAPDWFAGLDFPHPQAWLPVDVNWVMAFVGELLLPLLLFTRFAWFGALGLIYICFVAVYTSHFDQGWAGWNDVDDGFKIPLMYAVMLLVIVIDNRQSIMEIIRRKS